MSKYESLQELVTPPHPSKLYIFNVFIYLRRGNPATWTGFATNE